MKLLQVLDTTGDAERLSVSTPETAFRDYDSQCVALQMGKQNKMDIMSAEEVEENLLLFPGEDYIQENAKLVSFDYQNFPTVSIIMQPNVLV